MRLSILANQAIGELQKQFSSVFPFLKIEFFTARDMLNKLPYPPPFLPSGTKINEACTGKVKEGTLEFTGATSVAELERLFREDFSLWVQVFRKSGNLWLETTATDSWTLQQQNEHGREISESMHIMKDERPDYLLSRDTED